MIFYCSLCDFKSDIKSNYNKHLKSNKHKKLIDMIEPPLNDLKYNCKYCDKNFTRNYNLNRHEPVCSNRNIIIKDLENKIETLKHETKIKLLKQENSLLKRFIQNNKNDKQNITYNISIKNYIQQNFPEAPVLASLDDYSQLMYDDQTKTFDDDFISTLVYNCNNNYLHKYLGDFIIKYYKKDNPLQQSMWSSDTSRLTYIIKELVANNGSIWNHDYKGIKIKQYIINPLLKYIKEFIDTYWISNLDKFKTLKIDELNKLQQNYQTIYKIKKDIDADILGNDIIRYIAPQFYMHRMEHNTECITNN
jgi:hypothetical protein